MSAGHWIKWEKGLLRKPEVSQIAARLKIDRYRTAAHLMQLWEWCDDATEDGNIDGVTPDIVDDIAGIKGMAEAMTETKPHAWLVVDASGITIPNFDRHNGKSAKKRAAHTAAARARRSQQHHSNITSGAQT